MGGICSRSSNNHNLYAKANHGQHFENHESHVDKVIESDIGVNLTSAPQIGVNMEKKLQEPERVDEGIRPEDFYDGIPRYSDSFPHKSRSVRSRQAAAAKVFEVRSRLGRAGTIGLGKAVDVLDTLGSSMTNFNMGSGFVSAAVTKGNEIGILAFEVANTIVKGSNLMQSLSRKSIKHLKEEVLLSEAVQDLVSKDMEELLRILAADKREELKVFSDEVVRFGNRSKDPQWHLLDRYFEKISRELTPQKQLKDEAESVMEHLMELVQYTAELYHELHALDRYELDYLHKRQEEEGSVATHKGDNVPILRAELKSQRKQVKALKKKSLWSRSLEEVMEKLVDIVHFLHLEIHYAFGSSEDDKSANQSVSNNPRLGPAGLALHYANIVLQIDTLVARSSSMPANTRDSLYQSLPPSIKSALRTKLTSICIGEELNVTDIKAEMEKSLRWLVPVATNTAKAHHGFGWVGEWANTGSEMNRKTALQNDVIRIETFHHANKQKVEAYILELLVWLHRLAIQSKVGNNGGGMRPIKPAIASSILKIDQRSTIPPKSPMLTMEEEKMLQNLNEKRRRRKISKSVDFDSVKARLRKNERLSKSSSYSPTSGSKESLALSRSASGLPVIDFGIDKERALDVIDRLNVVR